MALLAVQEALAAILMQPAERKAFAADPRATLRGLGLKGKDLALLAGVDADDLAYFATRRNIDRHHALRSDAPLSVQLLEATRGRVQAYFRAHPFALEDPRAETARFARWAAKAARDGTAPALLPDLARYEAAVLRLMGKPFRPTPPSAKPRRARGQAYLAAQHRLHEALRSRGVPKATPGATNVVVKLLADDVRWHVVTDLEAALLEAADGRRTEAQWLAAAAKAAGASVAQARVAAAGLRKDGLVAPRTSAAAP